MQAERLEDSSDSEEEDCWREEDANVIVRLAQAFEAGRGCHFGCRSHGTSGAQPKHVGETQNSFLLRIWLTDV